MDRCRVTLDLGLGLWLIRYVMGMDAPAAGRGAAAGSATEGSVGPSRCAGGSAAAGPCLSASRGGDWRDGEMIRGPISAPESPAALLACVADASVVEGASGAWGALFLRKRQHQKPAGGGGGGQMCAIGLQRLQRPASFAEHVAVRHSGSAGTRSTTGRDGFYRRGMGPPDATTASLGACWLLCRQVVGMLVVDLHERRLRRPITDRNKRARVQCVGGVGRRLEAAGRPDESAPSSREREVASPPSAKCTFFAAQPWPVRPALPDCLPACFFPLARLARCH
jgi:hypothetical protein